MSRFRYAHTRYVASESCVSNLTYKSQTFATRVCKCFENNAKREVAECVCATKPHSLIEYVPTDACMNAHFKTNEIAEVPKLATEEI